MTNKDRRTKAELRAELDAGEKGHARFAEHVNGKLRAMAQKENEYLRAIEDRETAIGDLRKLLRLQSLACVKVAAFFEGKLEGALAASAAALKVVLGNTETDEPGDGTSLPSELADFLKKMEQAAIGEDEPEGEDNDLFGS